MARRWVLRPSEDIGITIKADALGYERDPNGYDVICGHCGKVMLDSYKPQKSVIFSVITCQHCGGVNRFNDSPPED